MGSLSSYCYSAVRTFGEVLQSASESFLVNQLVKWSDAQPALWLMLAIEWARGSLVQMPLLSARAW